MPTAILLVNLGTPNSPHPRDVYRYLIEFLTDERVIDYSWLKRQLLVRGLIVPTRYKTSAKAYSAIWTNEGSPLLLHSINFKEALQKQLGEHFQVGLAMRYQQPSLKEELKLLLKSSPEHLIVFPLFPQYASATTGSVNQLVMECMKNEKVFPKTTFLSHFANHANFIEAIKQVSLPYSHQDFDHVVFSFHGLPKKQLHNLSKNYCYYEQCITMSSHLASSMKISKEKLSVTFQSRLGKDPWLEPYTGEALINLARSGKKRVLIFCPSFVCDCLETIFEIGEEYNQEFLDAGGEKLQLVPGLNSHPAWVNAAAQIIYSCSSSH